MRIIMKNTLLLALAISLTTLAGCATNKGASTDGEHAFQAEIVQVLVEGRDRGVTPMTLRVSRSRGEYDVQLVKGREVVRVFEVGHGGRQRSPEQHALDMDLESDRGAMGFRTLGIDDLETMNDTLYIIPYTAETLAIDDTKYGLTLLISH